MVYGTVRTAMEDGWSMARFGCSHGHGRWLVYGTVHMAMYVRWLVYGTVRTDTTMDDLWHWLHGHGRWLVYGTVQKAMEDGWYMALFTQVWKMVGIWHCFYGFERWSVCGTARSATNDG